MKINYKLILYIVSILIVGAVLVYGGFYVYDMYQNKVINDKIHKVAGIENIEKIGDKSHEYDFKGYQKEIAGFTPQAEGGILRGILLDKFDDRLNQPSIRIDIYDGIVVSVTYPNLLKDCHLGDGNETQDGYRCWNNLENGKFYEFKCVDSSCNNVESINLYNDNAK